ncbi:MAG TPA: T9SS type A sorting domain-containing protein [Crocinitomicaceae bacterium]|nr:T9SS type A sorting domain-containing protein [Crocinitomicaceae bacterium]
MKKIILTLLGVAFISLSATSQKQEIDLNNTRPGESVEYCVQHKKMEEYFVAHPEAREFYEANFDNPITEINQTKAVVRVIPVVFHVLHNGGEENISREQIYNAVDILNRDYAGENADLSNVDPEFIGFQDTADIVFRLATRAPDGTCFSGITRTQHALSFDGSSGGAQVTAIINGNDVYNGQFPGNMYLNVFVIADAGVAAGYTTNPIPGFTSMNNGIWILHQYVGDIETGSAGRSRALTHEVGHWLNLSHPWGGTNNPGGASNCSIDDGVSDTPRCAGTTVCNFTINSCNEDNAYWGYDKKDNIENFMEYSYCSKMFTIGQVTRMRNALQSSTGGRNNVYSSSNLTATGATGILNLCDARFTTDKTTICAGDSIQFTNDSYNVSTGWTWSFSGADVTSSTDENPRITYSTPGLYTVTLNATDGTSSDIETKTNFIRVLGTGLPLPFIEGFESYTSISNITEWEIENGGGNGFELDPNVGHTGVKSARLINNNEDVGNIDELQSGPIDLTSVSGSLTLSFRYAFKRKSTSNSDEFKVYVTNNCGNTWALRKIMSASAMSSAIQTQSYVPSSQADWTTIHVTNISSAYLVDNFRCKFQFKAGGGNNFYIDNINIYAGSASEEIVDGTSGLEESGAFSRLSMYPNPTEGELNVGFDVQVASQAVVRLIDVSGKVIQSHVISAAQGANLVALDTQKMQSGVYFMNIEMNGSSQTKKFIVK